MAENIKVNWANTTVYGDAIKDLKNDLVGTLSNLILLEEKANNDLKQMDAWMERSIKITKALSGKIILNSKSEADKFIEEYLRELGALIKKLDSYPQ